MDTQDRHFQESSKREKDAQLIEILALTEWQPIEKANNWPQQPKNTDIFTRVLMFTATVINDGYSSVGELNLGPVPRMQEQGEKLTETLPPHSQQKHQAQQPRTDKPVSKDKNPSSERQSSNYTQKRDTIMSYISKCYFRLVIRKRL